MGPRHPRRAVMLAAGARVRGAGAVRLPPHWRWTGFTGNTVWNWLHLLLLPLLVPVVIVPLLRPRVTERFRDPEKCKAG